MTTVVCSVMFEAWLDHQGPKAKQKFSAVFFSRTQDYRKREHKTILAVGFDRLKQEQVINDDFSLS